MAHRPAVKTQELASFGVGPGIESHGCDLPAPDILLPLPALISPQRGVPSDPFNSSSSIITCKVVSLNQYTYNLFLQVLTFPPPVANTLTLHAPAKKVIVRTHTHAGQLSQPAEESTVLVTRTPSEPLIIERILIRHDQKHLSQEALSATHFLPVEINRARNV